MAYIFKNLAAGQYAPQGQGITIKITGDQRVPNHNIPLPFGQAFRYNPQPVGNDVMVRFKPAQVPLGKCRIRARRTDNDITLYIVEYQNHHCLYPALLAYARTIAENKWPLLRQYIP
jgi:hypothetical protein